MSDRKRERKDWSLKVPQVETKLLESMSDNFNNENRKRNSNRRLQQALATTLAMEKMGTQLRDAELQVSLCSTSVTLASCVRVIAHTHTQGSSSLARLGSNSFS